MARSRRASAEQILGVRDADLAEHAALYRHRVVDVRTGVRALLEEQGLLESLWRQHDKPLRSVFGGSRDPPSPGKVDAIVLDHAGNVGRLGLPHKIHYEELDDGTPKKDGEREKKQKRDPLPRICPECSFVNAHDVDECEQCGHRFIVRTNVRIIDGELVEFGSDDSGDWNPTTEDKARFFGELKYLSQSKGYKEGRAADKFKEKFGCWPNDWRVRNAKPMQPSLETIRWIRSRQIAWSKARAANG